MNGVVVSVRDSPKPSKLGVWVNNSEIHNRQRVLAYILKALELEGEKRWTVSVKKRLKIKKQKNMGIARLLF